MNKLLKQLFLISAAFSMVAFADDEPTQEPATAESKGTVLITGANRGLGLALVKQFQADNYVVYGTARKPDEATELKETGANVVQLDVTSEESIAALVETLDGKPIDILVNNAGYFGPNPIGTKMDNIDNLTRKELALCYAVNAEGPMFVTQALLPNLRAGKTKKIINMSTRSSIISRKGGSAYGYRISKAALNMATRTLHFELSKKGFIVVLVAPGHNNTDMGTTRGKLNPDESMAKVKKQIEGYTKKHSGGLWYFTGEKLPW